MRRNPAELPSWNIGIVERRYEDEILILLVDVDAFLEVVEMARSGMLEDALALYPDTYIRGYMILVPRPVKTQKLQREARAQPRASYPYRQILAQSPFDCGDIYEVASSAAEPGWGPLLYDVALYTALRDGKDGVVADRRHVSTAARRIWETYMRARPDVSSARLPGDCPMHSDDALNRAYRASSGFNVDTFEEMHREMDRALDKAVDIAQGPDEEEIGEYLENAGIQLFMVKFTEQLEKDISAGHPPLALVSRNPRRRKLASGTLPKMGEKKLNEVYAAVEERMLAEGEDPKRAASRASQIAWAEVKRLYYKRGKQWRRRKQPLPRPSSPTAQAMEGYGATLGPLHPVIAVAANRRDSGRGSLKRRLMR